MKAAQGIGKALLAIGLLMPLVTAWAADTLPPATTPQDQVTKPPAGIVPTPQELAPKPQPRRDVDVPRPAPPRSC